MTRPPSQATAQVSVYLPPNPVNIEGTRFADEDEPHLSDGLQVPVMMIAKLYYEIGGVRKDLACRHDDWSATRPINAMLQACAAAHT